MASIGRVPKDTAQISLEEIARRLANGRIAAGIKSGLSLAGDTYAGKVNYDQMKERVPDMAGLAMTGSIPAAAMEGGVPGALSSGFRWWQGQKDAPPLIEGLHGTPSKESFDLLQHPRFTDKGGIRDLGIHIAASPKIAENYAQTRWLGHGRDTPSRVYPVYGDVKNMFSTPDAPVGDPIKWTDPMATLRVLGHKGRGMRPDEGSLADLATRRGADPRHTSLWEELQSLSQHQDKWNRGFNNAFQKRGWDAIDYQHEDIPGPLDRAFMLFDDKQMIPKFSFEGQALAARRGTVPLSSREVKFQPDKYELEEYHSIVPEVKEPKAAASLPKEGYNIPIPEDFDKMYSGMDEVFDYPSFHEAAERGGDWLPSIREHMDDPNDDALAKELAFAIYKPWVEANKPPGTWGKDVSGSPENPAWMDEYLKGLNSVADNIPLKEVIPPPKPQTAQDLEKAMNIFQKKFGANDPDVAAMADYVKGIRKPKKPVKNWSWIDDDPMQGGF